MNLTPAQTLDVQRDVKGAYALYRVELAKGAVDVDHALDAACLAWQSTDAGLAADFHATADAMADAWRFTEHTLTQAGASFPLETGPQFWLSYMRWTDLGGSLSVEECLSMLRKDPTNLIPVLFVFMTTHDASYAERARELVTRCNAHPTMRSRYVVSVLEGALSSRSRTRP